MLGKFLCSLILTAIAASSVAEEIPIVRFNVTAFEISGANPLNDEETTNLLAPYTGEYAGLDGLLATVDAVQSELNARGFAFRRVVLPAQTLDSGVVRLEIVAITIAGVEVAGQTHFSDANILRSVPAIAVGAAPDQQRLSTALELANRHPSKQLSVRLRESEAPDAVDAIIDVRDRRPWQLFAGLNDIGTRDTGRTRVTVGAQHSNLFDRDHALTVSYTTSPENAEDVMQAGASYDLPLYAAHGKLSAFYSESDVDVGEISGFSVSGAGRFLGVAFTRLLQRRGRYSHEWQLGIQDRLFENKVDFLLPGGRIPIGVNVRSYPLALGYAGEFEHRRFNVGFNIDYSRNLEVGHRNDDLTYAAARANADASWDVVRFDWGLDYFLPADWLARAEMSGQWSDEALIPGEQFGLGGAHSVRGLNEREIVGDSGLRVGLDVISSPVPRTFGLRGFTFVDFGYFDRSEALAGETTSDTVLSAGLGLRWQYGGLSIESSFGHVFNDGDGLLRTSPDSGGSRLHFNVFYVF